LDARLHRSLFLAAYAAVLPQARAVPARVRGAAADARVDGVLPCGSRLPVAPGGFQATRAHAAALAATADTQRRLEELGAAGMARHHPARLRRARTARSPRTAPRPDRDRLSRQARQSAARLQ